MILNWFYIVLTQLITNFTISLRVSTSFKQSDYSKIDTSNQGQLPRAASELKCSLASSSKPILQPPTIVKMGYEQLVIYIYICILYVKINKMLIIMP